MISTFKFINVQVCNYAGLATILQKKVKGLILQRGSDLWFSADYCMRFYINGRGEMTTTHLLITDEHTLDEFVKAMALLEPVDIGDQTRIRDWGYAIEFPRTFRNSKQQARLEATLCQPFLKYWWGGFRGFVVITQEDKALKEKVVHSAASIRWSNVNEFITALDNARQAGKEVYNAGGIRSAYKIWKDALQLSQMNNHTTQGYKWNVNRLGTQYGTRLDEAIFHLHNNIAAACLKLAHALGSDPIKQDQKLALANEAVLEAGHADWTGKMQNFYPSNSLRSKALYRHAQGSMILGKLEAAARAMNEASQLMPMDRQLTQEAAEVRRMFIMGITGGGGIPG